MIRKKVDGGINIYILVIMFLLFFLLVFKFSFEKEKIYVTYDAVDDAIVSSLIAASPVNIREYGKSGQLIIYDDVTKDPVVGIVPGPVKTEEQKAQEFLTSADLFNPVTDRALNNARDKFLNSLKINLKLDDAMQAGILGINGVVTVADFSIYNRFEYYDKDGNLLHYRYIRYSHDGSAWSVHPYSIDEDVWVYNSFDKSSTRLDSTSVVADLSFTMNITEGNEFLGGLQMTKDVHYQRLVDVTK